MLTILLLSHPRPPAPPIDVKTEVMRSFVGTFDRWAEERVSLGVTMEHPGWYRRIRSGERELAYFYYSTRWLSFWLKDATQDELTRAQQGLSHPEHIKDRLPSGFWMRLYEQRDVDLVKSMLGNRVSTGGVQ